MYLVGYLVDFPPDVDEAATVKLAPGEASSKSLALVVGSSSQFAVPKVSAAPVAALASDRGGPLDLTPPSPLRGLGRDDLDLSRERRLMEVKSAFDNLSSRVGSLLSVSFFCLSSLD